MDTLKTISNQELIASLYKRCYTNLKLYFLSYTHDPMAAEDMLQDLFVKLMSMDVIVEETAQNLIFLMAKHMIINDVRHKAFVREREKTMRETMLFYDDSLPRHIESREILSLACKHLEEMSPKRAEVYQMYRQEELSSKEIAAKLHLSTRTVESHIYSASKEMKRFLKKII
ncbi:MAG: sigma-70 family RNA polymerase sigma factor [Prevotella sp.]|nr:sigma-70 family RNA polymerase sigma factor [Prevotella sp.]